MNENTFDDSKPVSKEEIKRMMEDAKAILSMQDIAALDESHDFGDTVIEVPKEEDVSIEDNGEDTEVTIQDSDTEIKEGDTFMLHVLDETLTYEVDRILIVEPDDVSNLEIDPDQDYCTLVTCTPYGINTHRLLVRGHRIANMEDDASVRVTADAMQIEPVMVAPIVAVPILIVLLIILMIKGRKK